MSPRSVPEIAESSVLVAVEPMEGGTLIWTAFVIMVTAVLLLVAAYAGSRGKLRPNPFFGIRTNLTSGNDEAWYAVHRKAAPWLAASGISMAVGGTSLFLIEDGQIQLVLLIASLAVCVTMVVAGGLTSSWSVRDEWERRDRASKSNDSDRKEE